MILFRKKYVQYIIQASSCSLSFSLATVFSTSVCFPLCQCHTSGWHYWGQASKSDNASASGKFSFAPMTQSPSLHTYFFLCYLKRQGTEANVATKTVLLVRKLEKWILIHEYFILLSWQNSVFINSPLLHCKFYFLFTLQGLRSFIQSETAEEVITGLW